MNTSETGAHPLDRPVWNTLATRQSHLAEGDGRARRLAAPYGIFAAAADGAPENLAALAGLLPAEGELALVEVGVHPAVPGAVATPAPPVCQMVAVDLTPVAPPAFEVLDLTDADAPEMLALATLTRPGPFYAMTHRLGAFVGVREGGRLVAMAGERMKLPGFSEVSGVCTDPDHRGRGYAAALMDVVARRMLARGETPFLHVYASNVGAIRLYEALGYAVRREMRMTLLARV